MTQLDVGSLLQKDIETLVASNTEKTLLKSMERISDVLESAIDRFPAILVSPGGLQRLAHVLLPIALKRRSATTREAALNLLVSVTLLSSMQEQVIDVEQIAANIAQFDVSKSEYALYILGLSGRPEYLPIIDRYRSHKNLALQEAANQAYVELSGEKGK